MKLLALDTAAALCSAAVFDTESNKILASCSKNIGRGHAEHLIPIIEACLDEAAIDFPDLGRISVTAGPGSFTGLRVGLSAARGFALSLSIPAVGISVLDCLRERANELGATGEVMTLMDAGRGEIYVRWEGHDPIGEGRPAYELVSAETVIRSVEGTKVSLCGSASHSINQSLQNPLRIIHTEAAAPIDLVAKLGAELSPGSSPPDPIYLRSADAKPQSGFALPHA